MTKDKHKIEITDNTLIQTFHRIDNIAWVTGLQYYDDASSLTNKTIKPIVLTHIAYRSGLLTLKGLSDRVNQRYLANNIWWNDYMYFNVPDTGSAQPEITIFDSVTEYVNANQLYLFPDGIMSQASPNIILYPDQTIGFVIKLTYQGVGGAAGDILTYINNLEIGVKYLE